jgi:hypothetical protein
MFRGPNPQEKGNAHGLLPNADPGTTTPTESSKTNGDEDSLIKHLDGSFAGPGLSSISQASGIGRGLSVLRDAGSLPLQKTTFGRD